jgi:hypothetical protein
MAIREMHNLKISESEAIILSELVVVKIQARKRRID